MARITLSQIQETVSPLGWIVISEEYQNLNTEMHFVCKEGHDIYAPWKSLRETLECPVCKRLNSAISTKEVKSKPRGATRILALDQASHTTGYAIFDDGALATSGTFEAKGNSEIERLSSIKQWLQSMVNSWKPDRIGIEGIQFQEEGGGRAMGVTVFETLAHLQGILMMLCYENHIEYSICPTNTWRHACEVKGRSRANKKKSMQSLVKQWYGVNVTDDVADAIGIGYYLSHKVIQNTTVQNWE